MTVSTQIVHVPGEATSWPIAADWARLDDLCDGVFDCPHTTPVLTSTGPFVVRSQDVRTGVFRLDQAGHVSEETYLERIDRAEPRSGDLLFSREGTYFGNAAEVPPGIRVCLGQRMVLIRPKRTALNSRFLRFWLNSPTMAKHIAGFKDGSVAERLNMPTIRALPIPRLHPDRQTGIASVLGALDDKIELNRRMNTTLEASARAIFKDWFVDFGPTLAKTERRAPYLAAEIWSLFPDRLNGDGKPDGWVFATLGDIARQTGESVKPESLDPGIPYIGLEHMPRKSIALSDWGDAGNVTSGKLAFCKGDFLFGKLRPYFHKVGIAPVAGICSTDIVVLNARERTASAFVLACISQDEFVAFTDRTSDGTKMPRTSWGRMERYGLCLPGASALEAFNSCVEPMLDRIVSNIHESRTLAVMRDLLLPKLISGEVGFRAAEKLVGEAT